MSSEEYIRNQIKNIKRELKNEPKNHSFLNDLGVGYYLVGEYKNATISLKAAIEICTENATYLFNLANAYSELEQHAMAQKFYLDALELEPGHIPSLTNLADSCEVSGDIGKAEELFVYITRLASENALAFFNLGNFQLRKNEHIKAVKNYKKAIQLEESFVDAYYNIAWVLTEVEAYNEAFKYAKKGLERDPNHEALKEIFNKIRRNIG